MKTNTLWVQRFAWMLVFPIVAAACAPAGATSAPAQAASASTITVSGNKCTYQGPMQIPAKVTFTFDIQDTGGGNVWSYSFVTLAEGKTPDDVKALPSLWTTTADQPAWLTLVDFDVKLVSGTYTKAFGLNSNSAYHGEPVYIICQSHSKTIGIVGPIEVTK
ncbi:MAG: hypothetical protein V1755_07755 [Chloroflexota bacterium]